MTTQHEPAPGDMRRRVAGGLAWVGASQVMLQLIRMVGAIIVARLLTPSEYGLAMLALVFASLVLVFSDLALGAALVQRKQLSEHDRSTAFWVTVASGALFTVLGVALSGPLASLYAQPDVRPLLAVLAASFLLTALGATQQALLLREMQFRRLELLTVAGALAGAVAAVVLAAMGTGPWAIVGQALVTAAVTSALLWRASPWRPSRAFSRASLRDLGGFSAYLVGHRFLFYLHQNADRFLIGRFVGAASLGVYAIAYNVMLIPATRLGGPLQRLLTPTFSRMQDEPERIAAAWSRVVRLLAAIVVPALAGLVVVAPDLVPVVLGEQWVDAVPIVQILAWVGLLQALQSINIDILTARDRTSTVFRYSVAFTTAHLIAFTVGLQWGVVGVAVGYAISSTLIEPVLCVLTARALNVSPWLFVRSISGVAGATVPMVAAVLLTRMALVDADVAPAARLVICVVAGALVYLPLCAWRVPEVPRDVRALLHSRRPASPTPSTLVPANS
jgi:O-antigen/teichoic acid export membrane protein